MAGLQDYLSRPDEQTFQAALARLPYVSSAPPAAPNSWIGGGLNAGIRELRSAGGSALEAVGRLTGLTGLEQWGAEAAANNARRAQEVGRPDLETAPWREDGAPVLPWLTYQTAKALPTLASMVGGGMLFPAAAVPAAAERAGAMVPAWLGGGAGLTGAAAQAAGAGFARNVLGSVAAGYLPAAGSIYRNAKESAENTGEEVTASTAAAALGAGLPSAALGALQPQVLRGILGRDPAGLATGVTKRLAAAGVEGALAQLPTEGAQAAIEMAFRPDMTLGQRAQAVVDAALTGAALGGVFGTGAGGLREMRTRNPAEVASPELAEVVDRQLALPPPTEQKLLTGPEVPTEPALPEARGEVIPLGPSAGPALPEARGDVISLGGPPAAPDVQLALPEPARPYQIEAPLNLPDQPAPSAPDLTARPLAREPLARLQAVITNTDYKRAVAQLDPAETAVYQAARAELDLRAQERDARTLARAQRELPLTGGADYPDTLTAPDPRPQPTGQLPLPETILRTVGVKKLPTSVVNAPDLPAALALIEEAASKRRAPKWALDAAETVGLDGSLDTRIADVQQRIDVAKGQWLAESAVDPSRTLDVATLDQELRLLQTRKAAIEEMNRRRTPEVAPEPQVEPTPIPPAPDTPVFSAARAATPDFTPLADVPFEAALTRARTRLGPAADSLRVVQSVAELPERVRLAAQEQGVADSDIRGTYYDGQGWLVRDNVRSEADVQEVALHEIFGHKGARTLLGEGTQDKMTGLFDKAGGLEGVMRIARRFNAETALREYLPDGDLTDADKARVFDEMLAQATGKADGSLKLTALTWAGQIKQQLIKFLEGVGMTALARRMDGFTSLDTAVMLRNMRKAVQAGYEVAPDQESVFSKAAHARDPVDTNESFKLATQSVFERAATVMKDTGLNLARRVRMYTTSPDDLSRTYGPLFPKDAEGLTAMDVIRRAEVAKGSERGQLNRVYEAPLQAFQELPAKVGDRVRDALNTATTLNLTPGRDWAFHTDLHNDPNAANLRAELMKLNKDWSSLRQTKGVAPVIDNLVSQSRSQWYLSANEMLRGMMRLDPTVPHQDMPSFQTDALNDLKVEGITGKSLSEIETRAKAALDATIADAVRHTESLRTELNTTLTDDQAAQIKAGKAVSYTSAQRKMLDQFSALETMVDNLRRSSAKIAVTPYVHLGRAGDYFVGGKITGIPDADGKVTRADQRSVKAISDALDRAGFGDVRMVIGNDNPSMFVRVETQSQAEALQRVMRTLQKQGHFQKDPIFKGSGAEAEVGEHLSQLAPHYTERIIAALKDRPEFREIAGETPEITAQVTLARDEMIRGLREAALELLPADSYGRLTARRKGVQGFSGDFARSQANRARAGVNHIVNLHYAPEIFESLGRMHQEVKTAERAGQAPINQLADMKAVYNEFFRRQSAPPPVGGNKWADVARSGTHSMLTAMSPAYAAVQLTSLMVTGLPELGKRFGYMASAKAMAEAAGPAFSILREAMRSGWKAGGVHGAADMLITPEVLAKAKVNPTLAQAVMRGVAMGTYEFGTQSQELGMLADADVSSRARRYAQYANITGYGAEAFTRLLMGIATHKLAKNAPNVDGLTYDVVRNSMFNFDPSNASRMLDSRRGIFGPATGLASVFLRFQSMLIEKLYGEFGNAFLGHAQTPAQRSEARRFLAGHAAALTVLGGTMALPMVSVLARLTDKIVDMTGEEGDEPYDVKAAWRNWLADVFGKEVGEIAARGLPRAAGIDISGRIGEQDILPFSKLLADRRKAEDIIEDFTVRSAGAGASTAINMWTGLNDIFNHGDYMVGITKLVPTALRNPLLAYKMGSQGYTDSKGAQLPVTPPSTRSMAVQAMGFTPSEVSEYREARNSQLTRKTDLETMAGTIRRQLMNALEKGDAESARELTRQMQVFDSKNPAFAVAPGFSNAFMQRRLATEVARVRGIPLGGNARDTRAPALTEWANY